MKDHISYLTLALAKKYIKELEGVGLKNAEIIDGDLIFTLTNDETIDVGNINEHFINDYDVEEHKTYSSAKIESIFDWTQYTDEITDANNFCSKGKNQYATLYGGNCINLPESNRWFMVEWHGCDVGLSQNGYGFQIARTVGANIQGKTFIRYKNQNDSWTNWQKVPQIPTNSDVVISKSDALRIACGDATTSGETRTITLGDEFTHMRYFNVVYSNFNALPIRNVEFTAPNRVSFQIRDANTNNFAGEVTLQYMFVGS